MTESVHQQPRVAGRLADYAAPLAGLGAAASLAAAFAFQHLGGFEPCQLCVWQRWPHVAGVLFGAAALASEGRGARLGSAAGAVVMTVGAGLALYHAGVEQGWWAGLEGCSGGSVEGLSTEALIARIEAGPTARCDEIPWSFAGLSMAAWNAILSAGLASLFAFGAASGATGRWSVLHDDARRPSA